MISALLHTNEQFIGKYLGSDISVATSIIHVTGMSCLMLPSVRGGVGGMLLQVLFTFPTNEKYVLV